ncbi:hypothetical protein [Microbacterium testaceum]|uniref:hypothetical protein n=1 Tax=Microbacterium testaceum TaxID=2033 RepID=UPI0012473E8F|nr:hypothetical protein [Microbacterium testaceum]
MSSRPSRPTGFAFCVAAAGLLAVPTLLFPADSPTEPKLVLAAVGAGLLASAVVLIRREPAAKAAPARPDEAVTEE